MKAKNIIIVILLLVICFGLGIIFGKKIFSPVDTEPKKEEKEKKKEEKDDVIVTLSEKDIEEYKRIIDNHNNNLIQDYPISDFSYYSNQDTLKHLLKWSYTYDNSYGKKFSKAYLRDIATDNYGADFTYKDEDIQCFVEDGVLYHYDPESESYSMTGDHGHGGEGMCVTKFYFDSGEEDKTKGILTINVKVLIGGCYGDIGGPVTNFYTSYDNVYKNGLYDEDEIRDGEEAYDEAYEKFKSSIPVTTFTFERDSNNHYGLKSISVNN